MANAQYSPETKPLIDAWQSYIAAVEDWRVLVEAVEPKATGCGPVYELDNPLGRPDESFAVADMRGIEFAQPHYHANGEVEVYFVLHGLGRVVVGNEILQVEKGSIVVTRSGTVHYALPDKEQGLVLAVVNAPSFNLANNIDVSEADPAHHYDHEIFKRLTQ
jgi:mannose-6-phosphate isomerase-like protein (cupin superfamily)